jgi:hypothetical protein
MIEQRLGAKVLTKGELLPTQENQKAKGKSQK